MMALSNESTIHKFNIIRNNKIYNPGIYVVLVNTIVQKRRQRPRLHDPEIAFIYNLSAIANRYNSALCTQLIRNYVALENPAFSFLRNAHNSDLCSEETRISIAK